MWPTCFIRTSRHVTNQHTGSPATGYMTLCLTDPFSLCLTDPFSRTDCFKGREQNISRGCNRRGQKFPCFGQKPANLNVMVLADQEVFPGALQFRLKGRTTRALGQSCQPLSCEHLHLSFAIAIPDFVPTISP